MVGLCRNWFIKDICRPVSFFILLLNLNLHSGEYSQRKRQQMIDDQGIIIHNAISHLLSTYYLAGSGETYLCHTCLSIPHPQLTWQAMSSCQFFAMTLKPTTSGQPYKSITLHSPIFLNNQHTKNIQDEITIFRPENEYIKPPQFINNEADNHDCVSQQV